jgi:hypothetical protein
MRMLDPRREHSSDCSWDAAEKPSSLAHRALVDMDRVKSFRLHDEHHELSAADPDAGPRERWMHGR